MKLIMKRGGASLLLPANEHAENWLRENTTQGEKMMVTITSPRNIDTHSRYFAFLEVTFSHMPEDMHAIWPSLEALRKGVQIEAGYFEPLNVHTESGEVYQIRQAKSIAFDKLGEKEFQLLFNRVRDVVYGHLTRRG